MHVLLLVNGSEDIQTMANGLALITSVSIAFISSFSYLDLLHSSVSLFIIHDIRAMASMETVIQLQLMGMKYMSRICRSLRIDSTA